MKLIGPNGQIVTATAAGAQILIGRGYYEPYKSGSTTAAAAVTQTGAAGWPDTHAALDEIADTIDGFEWPDPPAGKKKLTVDEKIDALKAAGYDPAND